jgi:two-component system CheB/CheR fusion protein
VTEEFDPELEDLLHFLREERGFDFTGYKRASLGRRVRRRMDQVGIVRYADYMAHLRTHIEEFPALFNTILINVTAFFRDAPAWEFLAQEALPRVLAEKAEESPIRVWTAGCASGEEAYTVAVILAEALGPEAFLRRVKIYATDIDEEALAKARQGYSTKEAGGLPESLAARYFELHGGRYSFRPDLRRVLIFGRHDLVQDAPISKLDLLVCRNVLMYFNVATQRRVLERLHYGLNPTGLLFLGKAEMLLTQANLFQPVNLRHRVFRRVTGAGEPAAAVRAGSGENVRPMMRKVRLRDLAQDFSPVAQITVDGKGDLVIANEEARRLFGIKADDVGRPLRDLQVSYRPVELRSRIEEATEQKRLVELSGVEMRTPEGEARLLDVRIHPLLDGDGEVGGVNVAFADVTRYLELQRDLERSRQDLETAYEELQSANEELQTTNEELQSTVEELETTNEELQSSNEELETMNEELESTNTELQAINSDLETSSADLESFRRFTDSVFSTLGLAVIALDAELKVTSWNLGAEEMWGLRATEVIGQAFFGLDIGLPLAEIVEPVKRVLAQGAGVLDLQVEAVNRRGRKVRCRISCVPIGPHGGTTVGLALVIDAAPDAG